MVVMRGGGRAPADESVCGVSVCGGEVGRVCQAGWWVISEDRQHAAWKINQICGGHAAVVPVHHAPEP